MDNNPSVKEIAEAFSTITGQALKKLSVYALIKSNTTDTSYSKRVKQQNQHIREKLEHRPNLMKMMDNNPSVKEIAEAFSTITGQEISEEEVNQKT